MSKDLQQLMLDREALDLKIKQLKEEQSAEAIHTCRKLIQEYELTEQDLFSGRRKYTVSQTKVAPKYRNPETGDTWTGRGKPPKWIAGQDREQFAI